MPYVERDGVRVWFEEHGRGAAVLLTHGYGATSRMWEPQWQGLGERFRLIAWDLRGHGRSDAPEDASLYSEAAAVGDMAAILDACGVADAVVGGLSLGGYLSLAFHLAHPGCTRALMLFDTGPGYRKEEGRRRWNAMTEELARGLAERGLAALGGGAEVRIGEHRSVHGLVLAARGILAQRDARVIESLPAIEVPTLVLWGERDEAFVKPGEYMAGKIPGATRVVLPNAGHAANLDQPQAFNAAVTSFVESVPA
jgi:pimeloyl-ACP methyl ester carboxylesterase